MPMSTATMPAMQDRKPMATPLEIFAALNFTGFNVFMGCDLVPGLLNHERVGLGLSVVSLPQAYAQKYPKYDSQLQ
jgi:hypothetical protein